MKKTIITIILIWFAISFTYLMITGSILNFESYVNRLNEKIPNFLEILQETKNALNNLINTFENAFAFSSELTFWQNVGVFFSSIWGLFSKAFAFMWQISFIPIKLIVYLFKVIGAFIPFFN